MTVALTEEQEEGLVEWFTDNEIFYNQALRDFKNKDRKERMMSEKAKELKLSLAELKAWLNSMWTMFGMLSKKKFRSSCMHSNCLPTVDAGQLRVPHSSPHR